MQSRKDKNPGDFQAQSNGNAMPMNDNNRSSNVSYNYEHNSTVIKR